MITCWPGEVRAGHVSTAIVDHVDLFASLAALVGQPMPRSAAVDSFDMLAPLLGRSDRGRGYVVEDSKLMVTTGSTVASSGDRILAICKGDWKLIRAGADAPPFHGNAIGTATGTQPYNIATDPGEKHDVARQYPRRTAAMLARLRRLEQSGRSRP